MHEEEKLVFELMIWCKEGAGERGEGRREGVTRKRWRREEGGRRQEKTICPLTCSSATCFP